MGMKQKKIFFPKKKFKMSDSKKAHFSKSPILKKFSRKFLRWVIGWVELNDAKGIDVAQRIWPWGCPTKAQKQPKSTKNAFFGCFWAFVDSLTAKNIELHRCPSHHSILLTQGQIWEIFAKKFWELAILKNELFLSRPFCFCFLKKNFFASFPWKSAQIYMVEWMGRNFDVSPGFQKIPCYA